MIHLFLEWAKSFNSAISKLGSHCISTVSSDSILAVIFPVAIAMSRVRVMIATLAVAVAAHILLLGFEHRLDYLSEVLDELIDIDFTAIVSVNLFELVPQLLFDFRCAPVLRNLTIGLFPGNAAVAVCVNMTPAELLVDSFLVLLGELSLGDMVTVALLAKKLAEGVHFSLGGLSSCDFLNVILP